MTTAIGLDRLTELLRAALSARALAWFDEAIAAVTQDPRACAVKCAGAARNCGREPLGDSDPVAWTVDEAARALLIAAVAPESCAHVVHDIYEHADPGERRAVLKALPLLDLGPGALDLIEDAIRTNDGTLIRAALGPYAAEHLPQGALRQAVLKCAFLSVPFAGIPAVLERADERLVGMLLEFVRERIVAGRDVDEQILDLAAAHDPERATATVARELHSPVPFRAAAARRAADRLAALAG
jgi:hypothetical protein